MRSCIICHITGGPHRHHYITWPLHLFAPTDQSGSLLDANLTILHQFVQVGLVVLRAVVCGAVQWITDLHLLDLLNLRQMSNKMTTKT